MKIIYVVLSILVLALEVSGENVFIENKGQWSKEIRFRAEIPGGHLYVFDNKLCYLLAEASFSAENVRHGAHNFTFNNLQVDFLKAQVPRIYKKDPTEEVFNFYIGNDPNSWAENVHGYKEVVLAEIYSGISLRLYFNGSQLEYDWEVAPHAELTNIASMYSGAASLKLEQEELQIVVGPDTIVEKKPFAYQVTGKTISEVGCTFVLTDSTLRFKTDQNYNPDKLLTIDPKLVFSSFSGSKADNWGNTATYDASGNLYIGGISIDYKESIHLGTYPVVRSAPGNLPHPFAGGYGFDVAIMKFSADGTQRLFSTYLGGTWQETPHSMIVNADGELIIMGTTSSPDFPVVKGGFDLSYNGGQRFDPFGYGIGFTERYKDGTIKYDATKDYSYYNGSDIFVVKFSKDLGNLISGTYLGGTGNDGIIERTNLLCRNYGDQLRGEVNVDSAGNILVASTTSSINFPIQNSSVVNYKGGLTDGVLVKLSPDLSQLLWSTYIGGNNADAAFGVCVDSKSNVFVTGGTQSSNLTTGYLGGGDGYVQKYSPDGLLLATRLISTANYDQGYLIQADLLDNVYVLGQTRGHIPVSAGVYVNPNSGQFIQKYGNDLTQLLLSTVVGSGSSNPDISPTAFLVNECGMIYITGWGGAFNAYLQYADSYTGEQPNNYVGGETSRLPINGSGGPAYQSTSDGSDFYIMILDQNATKLLYATYFGGRNTAEHVDGGTSRFDKDGTIYESVCACDYLRDYPTTAGVVAPTNGSFYTNLDGQITYYCNNAAFKFQLSTLKAAFQTFSLTGQGPDFNEGCEPLTININNTSEGGQTYQWTFGDNTTFNNFAPGKHTYDSVGSYPIVLVVQNPITCIKSDTAVEVITVNGFKMKLLANPEICKDSSLLLQAIPSDSSNKVYQWFMNKLPVSGSNVLISSPTADTRYSIKIIDTVTHCAKADSMDVKVDDVSLHINPLVDMDCEGVTKVIFRNSDKDATSYAWDFGDGSLSDEKSPVHQYPPGTYTIKVSAGNNLCHADSLLQVTIGQLFIPNLITPGNNDGKNDTFVVQGIDQDWKLDIYNRWGEPIKRYNSYTNDWNGAGVNDGVYYYLLTSPTNRKCKGWLEIVR